jgi:hypothetical protein
LNRYVSWTFWWQADSVNSNCLRRCLHCFTYSYPGTVYWLDGRSHFEVQIIEFSLIDFVGRLVKCFETYWRRYRWTCLECLINIMTCTNVDHFQTYIASSRTLPVWP